ncbi:hypothetical protein J6590_065709 [Homalodisca vitripennis]|nr:hypothetical protein J6590_065709 [Homalodisca vitripennis]
MLAVVSRSVLHEHFSGKRNNSLPLIFVKICQCEVYFRARLDDSSVSARCCVCSAWTKCPPIVLKTSELFNEILSGDRSSSARTSRQYQVTVVSGDSCGPGGRRGGGFVLH